MLEEIIAVTRDVKKVKIIKTLSMLEAFGFRKVIVRTPLLKESKNLLLTQGSKESKAPVSVLQVVKPQAFFNMIIVHVVKQDMVSAQMKKVFYAKSTDF